LDEASGDSSSPSLMVDEANLEALSIAASSRLVQRVAAYSCASSIDLSALAALGLLGTQFQDCSCSALYSMTCRPTKHGAPSHAVIFSNGAAVLWDFAGEADEGLFLSEIATSVEGTPFREERSLEMPAPDTLAVRLALSYALAQSAVLAQLESRAEEGFAQARLVQEQIAETGRILLSRREVRKRTGRVSVDRVSMHSGFFNGGSAAFLGPGVQEHAATCAADKASLLRTALEVNRRVEVLEKRFDATKESLEMVACELHNNHAHTLEWAIIFLIIGEILLVLLEFFGLQELLDFEHLR